MSEPLQAPERPVFKADTLGSPTDGYWRVENAEVWIHEDGAIVVMGQLHNDVPPEAHNCDQMGCGRGTHVIAKGMLGHPFPGYDPEEANDGS